MAPLVHLLALFSLALAVLAHPHISRNVYGHAHRAIAHPAIDLDSSVPLTLPKKRSTSKRCVPRPANTTSSASPTSVLPATSSVPINVAPSPDVATTSVLASSSPSSLADTFSPPPPPPPTTSVYVPPPTSQPPPPPPPTSSDAPPPPTSTPPPPPTSDAPPPAQTPSPPNNSGEPSFMIGTQYGQGTYYSTGLGACGITNNDSQYIAAVSHLLFDNFPGYDGVNPNTNPLCGKQVTISYQGQIVTVTLTDRCTACQLTDLDLSPAAFQVLASEAVGRINMNWIWI